MMQIHLEPFADEALHSYLLRLANGYGLQSSKQLLKAVNLKPRLAYDQQQLRALADEFGLSLDVLTAMNPTNEASTPILSLKYQRSGCSPICSQCIGEADYVRARWDHELISACTQHGVLLLDTCPGCCITVPHSFASRSGFRAVASSLGICQYGGKHQRKPQRPASRSHLKPEKSNAPE